MAATAASEREEERVVKRGKTAQAGIALGLMLAAAGSAQAAVGVTQTNLISDGLVTSPGNPQIDSNLINPWGISFGPQTNFWISENNKGFASVDQLAGGTLQLNALNPVVIATPPGQTPGTGAPTGTVFNTAGTGFNVSEGGVSGSAEFLFATEDGTISGWNFNVDSRHSILEVDRSKVGLGAVYKGLAIANVGGGKENLFASNFRAGMVEVFDQNFNLINSFTDPTVPKGYAPFNVQVLNGKLYVTFALQNASKHDDVGGPGHGFVDTFNLDGTGMQRIATQGRLNSPWGLAIAPASFGALAGDLLVGNFGNGSISVFDKNTNAFLGDLKDKNGNVLRIGDLWALTIGNGTSAGNPNTIYFTAGVLHEQHGLFGSLTATTVTAAPEPSTFGLMLSGVAAVGWWHRRKNGRGSPA
jgi:uncharacterized protein (TIGR03118 family)